MKPKVLLLARLPEALDRRLRERFDGHEQTPPDAAGLQVLAPFLRGIVANGESSVTRGLIERWPDLAFGMSISYTGRRPKADVAYRWCDDARSLAASVDWLVVLTPPMASTTGATVQAMLDLAFANLAAHCDGLPVPAPVTQAAVRAASRVRRRAVFLACTHRPGASSV
jgi:lactate dehydrogenase-like 2-hydroxyacid dehydrogenase